MNTTKIEWTEATWNPVTGCTPVSAGCEHCYAKRMANRLRGRHGYPADEPFRVTLHENRLNEPGRLRKPRHIFVCSMGDLFHEDVPDEFIDKVFAVMAVCRRHTFIILTKRPGRMATYVDFIPGASMSGRFLPNVWLGVTAENQEVADERIPLLLQTPAAVRYVSLEPLLGPIRIPQSAIRNGLDWVIVGGETGPGARPMKADWVRSIRDQCAAAGVPFFFKHWGEWGPFAQHPNARLRDGVAVADRGQHMIHVGRKAAGRLLDGRTHDAMPETG